MRNYNSKPAHRQPIVSNSFMRSQRVYPDPKPLVNKTTNMDQQKYQVKSTQIQHQFNSRVQPILPKKNVQNQKYCIYLKDPKPLFDQHSMISHQDKTCLWFKNIQKFPGKKISLKIGLIQYIISQWAGEDFPIVIYLTCQGMWGFLDQNSLVTDRISAIKLRQISVIESSDKIIKYALRYSSQDQQLWDIPCELTHLKFGIKLDNNNSNIQLPLPNPMLVKIQMIQQKQSARL